jgi:pSer/pThr/pTyr-binding forkhead associated (FHA) protein
MSDTTRSADHATPTECNAPTPPVRVRLGGPAGPGSGAASPLVTLIGGRRDCHVPVNHSEVSKVHCAIVPTGRGYLVCDLCTRTGTFVNAARVHVAPLGLGDTLRVGPVEVVVDLPAATADTPSSLPAAVALSLNGQAFNLAQTALVVGRRSTCDLVLNTPDVSPAHALVFAYRAQPVVFDLGSRSGTFVNARRVHLAALRDGDRLSIGGVNVRVECPLAATEDSADVVAVVPADDGAVTESAAPASGTGTHDPHALPHPRRAVGGDLAAAQRQLEQRALELDRRAAELDTLASLLELESEHLDRLKADRIRREAAIEHAESQARERLALAAAHEQAVTAAWEELDRWHARHWKNAAFTGRSAGEECATPPAVAGAEPAEFTNAAQPYPPREPPATRAGNV